MTTEIFHKINKERINKDLKIKDLCRLSGLSLTSWLNLKNGNNLSVLVLSKFCNTLKIKEIIIKFD